MHKFAKVLSYVHAVAKHPPLFDDKVNFGQDIEGHSHSHCSVYGSLCGSLFTSVPEPHANNFCNKPEHLLGNVQIMII